MLEAAFTRLLDSLDPRAAARALEAGAPPVAITRAVHESGFLDLLVPDIGGGTLADLLPLAIACGRVALPFPFAETACARAWIGPLPEGARVVLEGPGPIPFGGIATHVLHAEAGTLLLSDAIIGAPGPFAEGSACVSPGATIARAPVACDLEAAAAAVTAATIAGAVEAIAAIALDHAAIRQQFGKALAGFQAIQHLLARLSEEAAAARTAAAIAFAGEAFARSRSAIALVRAADAAREATSIAHQVMGAIGMTADHDLGLYTRRLHALRLAHGGADLWATRLADARLASPDGTAVDFLRALT
jgi:acyl-CoA dehydrogenase